MRVQHVDPLAAGDRGESPGAPPVQAGPPIQHLDREAVLAQLPPQAAQLVQTDEEEPIIPVQLPGQPGRQDLGPPYLKTVQDLADRGDPATRGPPKCDVRTRRRLRPDSLM